MVSAVSQFAPVRFSTDDLPERDRVAVWREVIARKYVRFEIEPFRDRPFRVDGRLRGLPGLGIMSTQMSEFRLARTSGLLADGNSDFRLSVNISGAETVVQRGREVTLGAGDATLASMAEAGSIVRSSPGQRVGFQIPYGVLAPLVTRVEDAVLRPIPSGSPALRLLRSYMGVLEEDHVLAQPEMRQLMISHVHDLVALALGATRDAEAVAHGRGVRAARLHAIKADIIENLGRNDLKFEALARRHRLHPRYIQRLFETDGTTFSEFLLGQRLARAHRMLTDPRHLDQNIGAIAFACGFGDLSYFNRCFRSLYGSAPSQFRAMAQRASTM
jgi:AraC-like DNA-binding protein